MNYPHIAKAIREGRFAEAQQRIARIGLTIDRDERGPAPFKTVEHRVSNITFICGLHRSGTTLFHDYLAKSHDVAFIQRARVPENEGQFLQDVYPMERPFGGPGAFAFYPQMRPGPVRNPARAEQLATRLLNNWAAYSSDPAHSHLLEKSPPNITRIPYLRSLFPQARFIIWTRDPRAVTISTQKWHNIPVNTLMHHWNCAYMSALEALWRKDCILLSYEDFCADPEGTTARVAAFCGITKRATPLDPANRFQTIRNSNQAYIDAFPTQLYFRAKVRAWEFFGYDF